MTESQEILQLSKAGTIFALCLDGLEFLMYGDQMHSSSAGRFTKKLKLKSVELN
jgi:hypothetical protein